MSQQTANDFTESNLQTLGNRTLREKGIKEFAGAEGARDQEGQEHQPGKSNTKDSRKEDELDEIISRDRAKQEEEFREMKVL